MKKVGLYILVALFILTACGKKNTSIDITKLSEDLLAHVPFIDELTQVDEKTVEHLYSIDNAVSEAVYIGSGATAEEIAIFQFASEEDADHALLSVQQRILDQKEAFESYIPMEVKRLDNAVLEKQGCYIILCVSDGTEAEKIIHNYLS